MGPKKRQKTGAGAKKGTTKKGRKADKDKKKDNVSYYLLHKT
jgi:hypothetical protein